MNKIIIQDGQYYIKKGNTLKPISQEKAIDVLLGELEYYRMHGEGD